MKLYREEPEYMFELHEMEEIKGKYMISVVK